MQIPPAIAVVARDGRLTPLQQRRFLIDLCKRRIRPGTGSGIEFLRRRTAMNPWPDLRGVLQDVRWVIVGGVATRAYMPERATKDLDILVRREDEQTVLEHLKNAGYQVVSRLNIPGWLVRSPEGVEIDVLSGDEAWLGEALTQPRFDLAGYPVIDLPYLVLMKMAASRGFDMGDLTRMLGLASDQDLARVRQAVRLYSAQDFEDLESLIYLGKLELGHVSGDEPGRQSP